MNSFSLHTSGLLGDEQALMAALMDDGWPQDAAVELLARYAAEAKPANRWQRWTIDELNEIDRVLAEAGYVIPGVAVTRPLAVRLGRTHKSTLSALERRLAARTAEVAG